MYSEITFQALRIFLNVKYTETITEDFFKVSLSYIAFEAPQEVELGELQFEASLY
jgi:hypothetical protein